MAQNTFHTRRRFLKTALQAGAVLAAPHVIPGAVLGKDGAVPPSEQIVMGGIGIGGRGSYDIGCFMRRAGRAVRRLLRRAGRPPRSASSRRSTANTATRTAPTYRDFRELLARPDIDAVLITTGSNWHALLSIYSAKAGKDVYCEKPCSKTIVESLALADAFRRTGPGVPGRHAAAQPAALRVRRRAGPAGETRQTPGGARPSGRTGRPAPAAGPRPARAAEGRRSTGTCSSARRPGGRSTRGLLNSGFEKGGGMVGGGCLEWGSHCIDMCQWANHADDTAPVEYFPSRTARPRPATPTA